MSQYVIDSEIKLGQCNRCQAYVFMAMSSGVRSAADVAPASRDEYVAALVDGRRCFDLMEAAGRPQKLLTRRLGSRAPTFDPNGAQAATQGVQGWRKVLVEHGCGGHQRNMITFREIEQGPTPSVCDTWKAQGWTPPPGKCGRARNPKLVSCPTCDKPPF